MSNSSGPLPAPIFIDFEGIDGSGKTTLSNRLADYLKECGVHVHHARDRGVFRSEISKAIRALTRDPRFLRMSDVTEFLLYTARDTQMIDEFIRPNLEPGNVVFSDRYLYSAVTHSHHGRGLPSEEVDAVLRIAARGIWPDLVVYCDVDPLTSRLRKKVQKIKDRRLGDFGRKGLMGIGFRERMRTGFLELAGKDEQNWLVIDNANSTIEESLQRIFERVKEIFRQKGYGELPDPQWADLQQQSDGRVPVEVNEVVDRVARISDGEQRRQELGRAFFGELDRLAATQPAFAALYVGGLDSPEATALRETLYETETALIAYGLQGVRSPESMDLREKLFEQEPLYVARSLSGSLLDPRASALRWKLADIIPAQIAQAVRDSNLDHAWELRDHIGKAAAKEVLMSLRGLDSDRAWKLREKRSKPKYYPALLESLGGIDTESAWEWRDRLSQEYLPWVLISLRGLTSDRAWFLRESHVRRAPKIIIKSIGCSEDPRAWTLREEAKFNAKEVLDSLSGLDSSQSWQLRRDLQDKWPNTCVSSLGAGAQSERAWNFRWEMMARHPGNLLLMKHLFKAALRAVADGADFEDENEDDLT